MYPELNHRELPLLSFFEKAVLCSELIKPSISFCLI